MRRVAIVACRWSSVTRRIDLRLRLRAAEHLQRRQPLDDVEEVPAEPGEQPPLPLGPALRVQPDERHEDRDERQRHAR